MVDCKLINNCKLGKHSAFEQMYESCAPYLYSTIKRYIKEPEDHKDVMQESFAKIFLYIKKYDPLKGEFKYWIRKIAVNESFKLLKQKKKLTHLNISHTQEDIAESFIPDYESLKKEEIDNYLQKMPERYRNVFMLSVIDGYAHKEIAQLLQINEATSRSQLSRAKKWIHQQILPNLKLYLNGTA